jgi:hypothetical protein
MEKQQGTHPSTFWAKESRRVSGDIFTLVKEDGHAAFARTQAVFCLQVK